MPGFLSRIAGSFHRFSNCLGHVPPIQLAKWEVNIYLVALSSDASQRSPSILMTVSLLAESSIFACLHRPWPTAERFVFGFKGDRLEINIVCFTMARRFG
jgi:hypothetical protein